VEFRPSVPYAEMPGVYAHASCLVLASLPTPGWEEQFGMVLVEALASGTPVIAAASGAIPEVTGADADLVQPGDWLGLARALGRGPLAGEPGARRPADPVRLEGFSASAAAERLRNAYESLLP
jgi:glycosyltransferase involved in cell wall biosynthesis